MSAPPNWICPKPLRDATDYAMRAWSIEHPFRRKPADLTPDEETREYAWALHNVPVEVIPLVAERVLSRSHGHWPRLQQVREESGAYLKRHAQRIGVGLTPDRGDDIDAARLQNAHCTAMLTAMGMGGDDVSRVSKMRCIAAMTEACLRRLQRQVDAGNLHRDRINEFRDGVWPKPYQLEAIVGEIVAASEHDLHGVAAQMVAGMAGA